jgi:poly-gamma-glutamate capsule biosynthesis protein CapA/YwtB (metallophosphatase superfamily)
VASRRVPLRAVLGGGALFGGAVAVAAILVTSAFVAPVKGQQPGSAAASATPGSGATPGATASADPAGASPSAAPGRFMVPVVPVASFWSPRRDIDLVDVARLWAGLASAPAETGYTSVVVSPAVAAPLATAFGIPPGGYLHIVAAADVRAAVRASTATLGLLAPEEVAPDVRALTVGGRSLFGPDRVANLADWLLVAPAGAPTTFSLSAQWTIDAGGDVNLDRRVYLKSVPGGSGVDFPWQAGWARIDRFEAGGFEGRTTVVASDLGPKGYLARKLASADITLVNLEGSVPNNWITRDFSLTFTFDPEMLAGMKNAGIDVVTLANNHILNGGDDRIVDTIQNLDKHGIGHTGAGINLAAARQPAWLTAGGKRVAVLGVSAVGPSYWARADRPGAAPLDQAAVVADIHAARAAGADIVVVMPHWGSEYTYSIFTEQKTQAAAFVAAGADLVLGSHSHWVGGVQVIDRPGGPAFIDYSMGDFLFDLTHDALAQQGVLVTLTFSGTRLLQVSLDPTVMINGAQVGLTDPAGDGRPTLDAIRKASKGFGL